MVWLEDAKIDEGPIFRRLIGTDHIGGALNPGSIAPIFKRVAQWIGMPERGVIPENSKKRSERCVASYVTAQQAAEWLKVPTEKYLACLIHSGYLGVKAFPRDITEFENREFFNLSATRAIRVDSNNSSRLALASRGAYSGQ
jgi:hypothetical protein